MRKHQSKLLLNLSVILLSLSACGEITPSNSSMNEDSSAIQDSSSKKEESASNNGTSNSSEESSSSESSDPKPEPAKTISIYFGEVVNKAAASTPDYLASDSLISNVSFSNCFGAERGQNEAKSNAVRLGSAKKAGSIDITFYSAIVVKRVNVYAMQFEGDEAVEYNLSSTANPKGMDITIEASEFTKFSYLYLDNDEDKESTSITFKANAKKRIFVSKIEILLSKNDDDGPSSSSQSSSSSSSESSSSSSDSSDDPDIDKDGYYKGINWNATGATLKTSLFNVISKNTKVIGYDGLWNAYEKTDLTSEGYIWDMYSNEKFNPKTDRAGNYKAEGDVYNREHSIPQSSFAGTDSSKMKSDIFHVYPTDGYVNNRRSSYPHGNVSNATYTSKNGSKLGIGNNNGYSGKVFEPIDEYKGDFARTYFYFVTRYQSSIPSMTYDSFAKNTYPSLSSWAIKTYLKWNDLDPVSEKEIKRNDAAYLLQNNRNPFIDHPDAAHKIWDSAI